MNDDRILEFMALVSDYMRDTDRRSEQLIKVMHDGFGRMHDDFGHLTGRVDHLTERVDHLTVEVVELKAEVVELKAEVVELKAEVVELKTDMREVKADISTIKRRLNATFDHAGHLTEQTDATSLRLSHVETSLQPTNAELDQRLREVENTLRKLA